jgi:catalase
MTVSSAPLTSTERALRLAGIAAVLGALALLFLYARGYLALGRLTPSAFVDLFEQPNHPHPGFRRNHAKGVGFRGTFESNGRGAALSKALVFARGQVPVIGRFALGGGMPDAADAPHTVRSLAVLFQLPNGEEWRTGMNNIPVFPASTALAFHDLLLATAPDPVTKKPNPEKMKALFSQHPDTAQALKSISASAVSSGFENSTYNSLNAFRFVAPDGHTTFVRWALVPVQPFALLDEAAAKAWDKNALFDGLIASARRAPLKWRLLVTLAEPGDPTRDATLPWPEARSRVDVGTLTVEKIESEETSPARDINFDPLMLPSGIEPSDDPILSARSAAYAQSFRRRESETKTSSAVGPAEVAR